MKRLILFTLTAVILISANIFATETRVLTMGDNNMVLVDDANISLFPGRNFNYPDLAIGEFNTTDDFGHFGMMWKFGDQKPWVLGTFFSTGIASKPLDYLDSNLVAWNGLAAAGVGADTLAPNRRIDLFYGRQFGTNNLGFNFGYTNSKVESDADQQEEGFTQFMLNFGLTSGTGDWDLAVGASFGSWTDKDGVGQDETESDGYSDFMIVGRMFHTMDPRITLVPHAMLQFGSHGAKRNIVAAPATPDTISSKLSRFQVGVGMNYSPARGVMGVFDFGFDYSKVTNELTAGGVTTETKKTDLVAPFWKIGMDAEVFKWLDIRLGAVSNWTNVKLDNSFKMNSAQNQTYLGTGMHWGRLHIDTYTNPELILDGLNFVSGSTDASDLNIQVTLLYEMF